MVKKIPKRKHHGVRDPLKQQAQRELLIKDKVNQVPKNLQEQEIPKKLKHILKINESLQNGTFRKFRREEQMKISKAKYQMSNKFDPNKPHIKNVPKIKKKPTESNNQFLRRINRITNSVLLEGKFEKKFKVDVIRDLETNEVIKVQKHVDILNPKPINLSKRQRYKIRKQKQKLETLAIKNNDDCDDEPKCENIKFGEVVHQPPNIKIPVNSKLNKKNEQKASSLLLRKNLEMYRNEVLKSYKLSKQKNHINENKMVVN